jgi:hypothetical protein
MLCREDGVVGAAAMTPGPEMYPGIFSADREWFEPLQLPVMEAGRYPEDDPVFFPWPPFMAFSLLHCRNVEAVAHEPTARERRQVERSGNPPRVTYKTLRIKLPEIEAGRRKPGHPDDEDARHVRFHLCRGHFKNLKHPRYKNPGWHWWPATWRGSRSLGEVVKRYKLEARA